MSLFSQILGKVMGHGHLKKNKKMIIKGIVTVLASKVAKKALKKFLK